MRCELIDFFHRVLHVFRGQPSCLVDRHDLILVLILVAIERRVFEFCKHNDYAEHDDGGLVRFTHAHRAQSSVPDSLSSGSSMLSLRTTKPYPAFRGHPASATAYPSDPLRRGLEFIVQLKCQERFPGSAEMHVIAIAGTRQLRVAGRRIPRSV